MSSAALQSAPHQPTTVGSQSPVAAATTSSRQYTAGSSQPRDPYYNQIPANASPSSTRRPSRRPSGNGATSNASPQPTQYYSPSAGTPTSTISPRATSTSNHASPTVASSTAPSGHPIMAPGDHQRGVPPVVSPRTSSSRAAAQAAASVADRNTRRGNTNEATSSPRQPQAGDGQQDPGARQRSNGNAQSNGAGRGGNEEAVAAATAAARSRRRTQQIPADTLPHRSSSSREARATTSASAVQSRPAMTNTSTSSPSGLSREASEVLNRVVISKPEVDIERERERMAEAVPSSPTAQSQGTSIGGLSIVPAAGVDDGGRGGTRSRHDHAASSGKREKNSRFGEYFLGNTLGEGEFGKVKMGWKQEGGVQVRRFELYRSPI